MTRALQEMCKPISLKEKRRSKNPLKKSANQFYQYVKQITPQDQISGVQGCFNIQLSINILITLTNERKKII